MADFFIWLTHLGDWQVVVFLAGLSSIYLWRRGLFFWFKWLWISLAGAELTTHILKVLVARPRPVGGLIVETGYSFPSGHAVIAVVLYGLISYFLFHALSRVTLWQRVTLCGMVVLVILIGYSRFYLGVHYFSDILGGYFIGLIWILIGQRLARVF